ncbi:FxLYD domain-containing protein [Brevundimonas sp. LjRoot202]|uniref:FxLYD domain-containing protein n=1 Tax=Brevundimonas sp. LjRoot202 TaxID=3342281 RepID=UPI003ECD228C
MASTAAWAACAPIIGRRRDELALSRDQLVREPLGGRTWRGALTNHGDGLCAAVAIEIRFLDRNGRAMGGFSGRIERLAPGGGLELQSRLPAGATGLQIQSLRWTTGGDRIERGPYAPWRPGDSG